MDGMTRVLLLLLLYHTCSGLEVTAPPSQTALFQSHVLLPCTFIVDTPTIDPQFLAIIWSFGTKELLRFNNKEKVVSDGMSFNEQAARQGKASLTIRNVTIANHGTYKCIVIYSPDRMSREIQLNVEATPMVKIHKKDLHKNDKNVVDCSITGFFPREIKVTWLRNNIEILNGSEIGTFHTDADGTFRVNSSIVLTPAQIQDHPTIVCQVEHVSQQEVIQDDFSVTYKDECKRRCHLGLTAVLMSLLIISLVVTRYILWTYIRTRKYLQNFHVSHIHKEHVRGNEEKVNLYCMASKCTDVVDVTWSVIQKDQKPIIISESPAIKDEEAGPLLAHEYTVKTDQTELNGLYNATTVLSFNSTISSHKNTEVICKFLCGWRCEERTLNFSFYYKKPSVKGPIDVSLDDSGNVVCSLTLENFYPRDVQIKWNYGVGNNQELPSTEDIKNDSDYTFQCNSICRIPSQLFLDPGFKVRVTWTHESLDQPGNQGLSLKDFPWRPEMDYIEVPSLVHGREAKLQCVIRGYFPNNLEVKWFRREAGKPELYEVLSGDRYKIPVLEITRGSDKTYTCTASLIVSVLVKTEHKSEFICQVTHPSLETPLEKRTGELTVTGIPIVTVNYEDNYLEAEISHFYPKKINVTWSRTKPTSDLEDKLEPFDVKDYQVSEPSPESDGTFTLTSSVLAKFLDHRRYKITVQHESSNSPIEKIFKKKGGRIEDVTEKDLKLEMSSCQDEGEAAQNEALMQPDGKGSKKKKKHFPQNLI